MVNNMPSNDSVLTPDEITLPLLAFANAWTARASLAVKLIWYLLGLGSRVGSGV